VGERYTEIEIAANEIGNAWTPHNSPTVAMFQSLPRHDHKMAFSLQESLKTLRS
jgi:hypothetical protein